MVKKFYFSKIEYYGNCEIVTIKYNDNLKDEIACINFQ